MCNKPPREAFQRVMEGVLHALVRGGVGVPPGDEGGEVEAGCNLGLDLDGKAVGQR